MRITNKILIVSLFSTIGIVSCSKKMDLPSWSFDVTKDKESYDANTMTTFNFTGKPDNITFYSGEIGKRYAFKDRVSADGIPVLKFTSALNTGTQPNSLSVLVSTDFAGLGNTARDSVNIVSATWTDITTRAGLATNATAKASLPINLSDLAASGKPVYIAFKYTAAAGTIQNKWTITNFSLRNGLSDGTSYLLDTVPTITTVTNYGATSALAGWGAKTISSSYAWVVNNVSMSITGATTAALATAPAESWAITGPIDLRKVTPDVGATIKNTAEAKALYNYTYKKAGNYEVTFIGWKTNRDAQESVKKSLQLTVK